MGPRAGLVTARCIFAVWKGTSISLGVHLDRSADRLLVTLCRVYGVDGEVEQTVGHRSTILYNEIGLKSEKFVLRSARM
jgi:hypothetical protein